MHLLVAHCQGLFDAHGGVFLALLMAGLLGSLTHCAGMCGPLVAAQTAARLESVPAGNLREWHRLRGAALLPYHFGRLTTYAGLGALAGGASSFLFASDGVGWLASVMLAGAGLLFLMQALGIQATGKGQRAASVITKLTAPFWNKPTGARGYALGVMLGFLPCGMVWAALMAVATTGSALAGGAGMLVFGLGTVPALFAVGLGSHFAHRRWPSQTRMLARGAMGISGLLLCAFALERMI